MLRTPVLKIRFMPLSTTCSTSFKASSKTSPLRCSASVRYHSAYTPSVTGTYHTDSLYLYSGRDDQTPRRPRSLLSRIIKRRPSNFVKLNYPSRLSIFQFWLYSPEHASRMASPRRVVRTASLGYPATAIYRFSIAPTCCFMRALSRSLHESWSSSALRLCLMIS